MARISAQQAGGINRVAFLELIASGEIGSAIEAQSDDGYNVLVGSTPNHVLTFDSYTTHPNVLNQVLNSTAAGRYQFLSRYWAHYRQLLNLPDFSPLSQDIWAIQLVRERQALPLIDAGRITSAITLCNNIWASLPGSPYGQRTSASPSINDFLRVYTNAGGSLA